jgi:Spy/CpxP family protein refolding chaperone
MTARRLLVALLTLALATATAESRPPGMAGDNVGGAGGVFPVPLMIGVMTPAQRKELKAIQKKRQQSHRDLVTKLRAAQEELTARLLAPGDAPDLGPQVQRLAALRKELLEDGLKGALEIRALLTPEQLARVAQVNERLRVLRQEMRRLLAPEPPADKADKAHEED